MVREVARNELTPPLLAVVRNDNGVQLLVVTDATVLEPTVFDVPRATKKSALRFAVGEPGRRGTVWRLWVGNKTDDVYLASRNTAGAMKMSFHQSGDWRLQLIDREDHDSLVVQAGAPAEGRILERWRRPAENAVGWTHGVTIVTPGDQLSEVAEDEVRWDDVRWHEAPAKNQNVEFEVHLVTPQLGAMSYRQLLAEGGALSVMDGLLLPSGAVVIVVAITTTPSRDEVQWLTGALRQAAGGLPPSDRFDRDPRLGPRHMLNTVGPDGRHLFFDVALQQGNGPRFSSGPTPATADGRPASALGEG